MTPVRAFPVDLLGRTNQPNHPPNIIGRLTKNDIWDCRLLLGSLRVLLQLASVKKRS